MTGLPSPNTAHVALALALLAALGGILATGALTGAAGGPGVDDTSSAAASPSVEAATASIQADVSEPAVEQRAPEPGDEYYEASDSNGNWISYINPRDEYRSPYLGDGSGKICVTLLNEAGEPVVGESVPNTTVTIPTGDELTWHSQADPMTVEYPLTDNYDWPLDADQFGTSPDIPQGDGYMDSHCIEMHGQPEGATIEYGEARIEGDHADDIELVGYVEQPNKDWDTDVDPIADAESYEEVGGDWTFESEKHERLHGQVTVVLQLDAADGEVEIDDGTTEDNETDESETDDNESETTENESETNDDESTDTANAADEDDSSDDDEMPGFGFLTAAIALSGLALIGYRHRG